MMSKQIEEQVHALFGDSQIYDGGYFSCYDGGWLDMTNEVVAVASLKQQWQLEAEIRARLDELNRSRGEAIEGGKAGIVMSHEVVENRIADLEARLKQLQSKEN